MSKACYFCGKGSFTRVNGRHTSKNKKAKFANRGPHGLKAVKSIQTVRANLREVRLEKGTQKVTACMSCYKAIKPTLAVAV
jgi:ribosomal protein L28